MTLNSLNSGVRVRLLLKSQNSSAYTDGALMVDYTHGNDDLKVMSYTAADGWVRRGSVVTVTFAAGDRLGVQATADGQVKVYQNSTLLTTVDVTAWPYYANGGTIGLWTRNNTAVYDDFGGGTIPSAFRLGKALAALWEGVTGWVERAFGAGKVLAAALPEVEVSAQAAIVAPPERQTWKNYVFAGSTRVAVRVFETGSVTGEVFFLLSDHLGSVSVVADASGNQEQQIRYTAYGEVRAGYTGASVTDYEYTGQLSQVDDIGLVWYRSRWLDPLTAHFAQADTIVPLSTQGVLAHDRYAAMNFNPIRYTDPSGHRIWDGCSGDGGNCGNSNKNAQITYEKRTPMPRAASSHPQDSRGVGSACSGSNLSVVCKDPTLIAKGQVQTPIEYPTNKTPDSYDGPYVDKTGVLPLDAILLAFDAIHYVNYQTKIPAMGLGNNVSANISYELHSNGISKYTVVTSIGIANNTESALSLDSVKINQEGFLYPDAVILLEPNVQSALVLTSPIMVYGSSTTVTLNFSSLIYNPISLTATYP